MHSVIMAASAVLLLLARIFLGRYLVPTKEINENVAAGAAT
jgi:hypothetical protein